MSVPRIIPRRGALLAGMLAVLGASAAVAQIPRKPIPKDTATKPVAKATHIQIQKEQTSGGEVMPLARVDTMKVFDTIVLINAARDDSIRDEQFRKDSVINAFLREGLIRSLKAEAAAERDRIVFVQTQKEQAAAAG